MSQSSNEEQTRMCNREVECAKINAEGAKNKEQKESEKLGEDEGNFCWQHMQVNGDNIGRNKGEIDTKHKREIWRASYSDTQRRKAVRTYRKLQKDGDGARTRNTNVY